MNELVFVLFAVMVLVTVTVMGLATQNAGLTTIGIVATLVWIMLTLAALKSGK